MARLARVCFQILQSTLARWVLWMPSILNRWMKTHSWESRFRSLPPKTWEIRAPYHGLWFPNPSLSLWNAPDTGFYYVASSIFRSRHLFRRCERAVSPSPKKWELLCAGFTPSILGNSFARDHKRLQFGEKIRWWYQERPRWITIIRFRWSFGKSAVHHKQSTWPRGLSELSLTVEYHLSPFAEESSLRPAHTTYPRPFLRENVEPHWAIGLFIVGTAINVSTNDLAHPSTISRFQTILFYWPFSRVWDTSSDFEMLYGFFCSEVSGSDTGPYAFGSFDLFRWLVSTYVPNNVELRPFLVSGSDTHQGKWQMTISL